MGIRVKIFIVFILLFSLIIFATGFINANKNETSKNIPPSHDEMQESPLVNILPHTNISAPYTIQYITSDKNTPVVSVSNSTPIGRERALDWLRSSGYNPTYLKIIFVDYSNQITGESIND